MAPSGTPAAAGRPGSAASRWRSTPAGTGLGHARTAGCRCGRSAPSHGPSECAGRCAPTGFRWPGPRPAEYSDRLTSTLGDAGAGRCGHLRSRSRRQNHRCFPAQCGAARHTSRRKTPRSTYRCRPGSGRRTAPLRWGGGGTSRGCARTGQARRNGAVSAPAPV